MKPRLRAISLVLILAVYGVALKRLDAASIVVLPAAPVALAQPYPGLTPTPTDGGYPGPAATGAATATATATPVATAAATATPTASHTVAITLSPTPRRPTVTATPTPTGRRPSATPTPTSGGRQVSPTPTTRNQPARVTVPGHELTPNASEQEAPQLARETRGPARDDGPAVATPAAEAIVAPTESLALRSQLARNAERPVLPSLAPPAAYLLPPVANQPAGLGAPLTLAVGAVVAGLAYWAWRRWEPSDAEE